MRVRGHKLRVQSLALSNSMRSASRRLFVGWPVLLFFAFGFGQVKGSVSLSPSSLLMGPVPHRYWGLREGLEFGSGSVRNSV
jgi:hypothetical protein